MTTSDWRPVYLNIPLQYYLCSSVVLLHSSLQSASTMSLFVCSNMEKNSALSKFLTVDSFLLQGNIYLNCIRTLSSTLLSFSFKFPVVKASFFQT